MELAYMNDAQPSNSLIAESVDVSQAELSINMTAKDEDYEAGIESGKKNNGNIVMKKKCFEITA